MEDRIAWIMRKLKTIAPALVILATSPFFLSFIFADDEPSCHDSAWTDSSAVSPAERISIAENHGRGIASNSAGSAGAIGTEPSADYSTPDAFQPGVGGTMSVLTGMDLPIYSGITHGDIDGDGKADIGIWRPANGVWYVLHSSAPGTYTSMKWGSERDLPVAGDYDGDGKMDFAVWHPLTGDWDIIGSSEADTYIHVHWGMEGDVPVPADYDGDGKTDLAVWRPEGCIFYALSSKSPGTYTVTRWGLSSDIPVLGRMKP